MAAVVVVMVAATLVERFTGSGAVVYGSWWFASLWAALAVTGLLWCMRRRLWRRPFVLLLHVSLVVILLGALVTHVWGVQGTLHLRMGEPVSAFDGADGRPHALPFTVGLADFEVIYYPGTPTPMDYRSTIALSPLPASAGGQRGKGQTADRADAGLTATHPAAETTDAGRLAWVIGAADTLSVSMNRIATRAGYRFYQSGYDADGQGTLLSVNHDPAGIGITYVGYGLLFLSMLVLLALPGEGFRRSLRRLSALAVAAMMWPAVGWADPGPRTLTPDEAHAYCRLYTCYGGRICPMQTVARDFTLKLYGRDHAAGYGYEQVFTGWLFFPTTWTAVPRKERSGRYADEQGAVVQMLYAGQFSRLYPYRGEWLSPLDYLTADSLPEAEWLFVKRSLDYMGELAARGDHDRFMTTVAKVRLYQQQKAGEALPSEARVRAEMLLLDGDRTRPLAMALATLGLVGFAIYVGRLGRGRRVARWVDALFVGLLGLVAVYLTLLLGLRWYVSGHLPLASGFETMQFMALSVVVLALVLRRRLALIVPIGCLLCGLCLMVSMFGQSNPPITLLIPVLQSPLLSVHVCLIMVSYSLLAFTCLTGVAALLPAGRPIEGRLADVSRVLLYPALFCMAGGIFTGAIWAGISWGRYWGWDPKEVWALITLLVYAFALHSGSLPALRRPRTFHLVMVVSFLAVLMTYFGVNYLLGGMHSYA